MYARKYDEVAIALRRAGLFDAFARVIETNPEST